MKSIHEENSRAGVKITFRWELLMRVAVAAIALLALAGCRNDERGNVPLPPASTGSTVSPGAAVSYADVVSRVAPAVVTIRSERRVRAPRQHPFFNDPFFRDFFGGAQSAPREQIQRGLGSGVIVTKDGYLLTNHHVIDGAEEIRVEMTNNRVYDAKIVGTDPRSDLAALKINANDLPLLTLGDSDRVRVGDVALAVGNPLGVGQTVTAGIISAKGRATGLSDGSFESFLQTDAPINQGNSGGALVNTAGELIGINSQILTPTGGNIGIGFAIPANMARSVFDQLTKSGRVRRGHLGVTIQPVTSEIASNLGMNNVRGVIVSSVEQGGPAERAGLKQGDVIIKFNGNEINDSNSLRNLVASAGPDAEVTLTVVRDGREQELRAKLGELPSEPVPGNTPGGGNPSGEGRYGMSLSPLTPDLIARLGLRPNAQGVVVLDVDPAGPAADAGMRPGDVIEQVNRQPVRSLEELRAALDRAGSRPALLLINRRNSSLYLTLGPRG